MKEVLFLLLLGLFLVGCDGQKCADQSKWKAYKYGDKVLVVGGFYKGRIGYIVQKSWVYERGCSTNAFVVQLEAIKSLPPIEVRISQFKLFVTEQIKPSDDIDNYLKEDKCNK